MSYGGSDNVLEWDKPQCIFKFVKKGIFEWPYCWCNSGEPETYLHLFLQCQKNNLAGAALLRYIKAYDKKMSQERTLQLENEADETFLLPTVSILAVGLEYIWEQRKLKKTTSTYSIRAELEAAVSLRRRSWSKKIREAGNNCFC